MIFEVEIIAVLSVNEMVVIAFENGTQKTIKVDDIEIIEDLTSQIWYHNDVVLCDYDTNNKTINNIR